MNKQSLLSSIALVAAAQALSVSAFKEGDAPPFDLAKALADPKAKQALTDWAENEFAKGLKAKNEELLQKLLKYKVGGTDEKPEYLDVEKATQALAVVSKLDPSGKMDVNQAIATAVAEATGSKDRDIQNLTTKLADATKATEGEIQRRHKMMVDGAVRDALGETRCKQGKQHLHQMYLSQFVTVEVDKATKEERVVVLDDKKAPKYGASGLMKVSEFVKEYSSKDGVAEDWEAEDTSGGGTGARSSYTPPGGGKTRQIDPNLPATERLRQARQ